MKENYVQLLLPLIPRILSQQDRNIYSPTYGCFDRNFWHYKITDTASARYQEAVLTLALLYTHDFPGNIYFSQSKIKKWVEAGIEFWSQHLERDGSTSEWYPHEHSFVATAFSLYAVSESVLLLSDELRDLDSLMTTIRKAADWLTQQKELQVCNQQAGSAIALYNVFLITHDKKYLSASQSKINQLLEMQTEEGWFAEYGGADIGYSSVLVDYLGKYYLKSGNSKVAHSACKLLDFLAHFVHPNNTVGGEYGSRNTEYLLPHGLEIFSDISDSALLLRKSLYQNITQQLSSLDDRYLCYNGYTFLQAAFEKKTQATSLAFSNPKQQKNLQVFPGSGLYTFENDNYYFVGNSSKAGGFKLYSKKTKKLVYESSGMVGKLSSGEVVSNQWLDSRSRVTNTENTLTIAGAFVYIKSFVPTSFHYCGIRLLQHTVGRSLYISHAIKNFLRKILITKASRAPIAFVQKIYFKKEYVKLVTVIKTENITFQSLQIEGKFSLIYIPSSRYFHIQELDTEVLLLDSKLLSKLNIDKQVIISKKIFT